MAKSTARALLPLASLLAVVISVAAPAPGVSGAPSGALRATTDGRPIPLTEISSLYCHDLAYPLIRCFRDRVALRADEARVTATAGSSVTVWVTWYRDVRADSGGPPQMRPSKGGADA